jgi:predicted aminopeptidase
MFRLIRFCVFEGIMLFVVLFCCFFNELVMYGLAQGKGQVEVVMNARPLDEVLKDPSFPDSLKQKLRLIQEIKQFATDSLGLKPSQNYTTVYDQHNKAVLWTITASEPFRMKAREWTFPFLGAVSYKGFFDFKKGKQEADELAALGYDVDYGAVSGWSTLGWFKDPILTHMLNQDEGRIADLIIHELTHSTIYLKSSVNYNENLANFIGDKGAQRFLTYKYGQGSAQLDDFIRAKTDRKLYNAYILHGATLLDSLYKSFGKENVMERESKKMNLIYAIVNGVDSLPLRRRKAFHHYTQEALQTKNAFFMSFRRYDSQYDVFEADYEKNYKADLRLYIQGLVRKSN